MKAIEVKKLGLAAYVKMRGGILVGYESNLFLFNSNKTIEEWNIEYLNSCCYRHDAELMALRNLIQS